MAKSKMRTKKRKKHKPVRRVRAKVAKRHNKPVARKRRKKSVHKKAAKRRKRSQGRKLVKQVERRSVERVMAGKHPRKRKRRKQRRVRMAGLAPRRRAVGKSGSGGLLLGLAIGAGALYLLTRGSGSTSTATNYGSLPPLTSTGNYTRDTQSQQIVNYALAAGLTINAITSLINSLNSSSDSTVNNVYDKVNTTGQLTDLGLPGYDTIV